jgi:phosphoribosyl-AMP cyclohydrolase
MAEKAFQVKDLKFDDKGLIPAIIQDYRDNAVLMLAYMNAESVRRTLKLGKTCFWSRSRKEYWVKGETSGHFQFVKSIAYDCDLDALLIKVRQAGVACHTGNRSCFYRNIKLKKSK